MVPQGWASGFPFFLQKLKCDILPSLTKSSHFFARFLFFFFPVKINWCSHWLPYLESQSGVLYKLLLRKQGGSPFLSLRSASFALEFCMVPVCKSDHGNTSTGHCWVENPRWHQSPLWEISNPTITCMPSNSVESMPCSSGKTTSRLFGIRGFAKHFPSPRAIYNGKKRDRKFWKSHFLGLMPGNDDKSKVMGLSVVQPWLSVWVT